MNKSIPLRRRQGSAVRSFFLENIQKAYIEFFGMEDGKPEYSVKSNVDFTLEIICGDYRETVEIKKIIFKVLIKNASFVIIRSENDIRMTLYNDDNAAKWEKLRFKAWFGYRSLT